jgi:hypothetical protein
LKRFLQSYPQSYPQKLWVSFLGVFETGRDKNYRLLLQETVTSGSSNFRALSEPLLHLDVNSLYEYTAGIQSHCDGEISVAFDGS